ncbi:YitT family protein [Amycolatopsis sp.]|uniref:membrane protein YczE n=1 Tax=Amycolatopsis sp. TaxID=37632 RepID=UPI002639CED8|nr:YitT family protein [Amycolatopsis sp.]
MAQVDLRPVPITSDPARRVVQLVFGLALYGTSMAMMTRARLGLDPWDVLNDGVSKMTGLSFGTMTAAISIVVLLLWIPLRQRPGIGTVANIFVISVMVDLVRAVLPAQSTLIWQILLLVGGVVLNAVATAVYVGARLGPGPRDGLMTGLTARTGWSVRLTRTGIEVVVLVTGFFLGGSVGVGTVLYALSIGPLTQLLLPFVTWKPRVAS